MLAAVYSEAGRFPESVVMGEKACALASEAGDQSLLQRHQELLKLYHAGRPFHEAASAIVM
jgi:hypothetical protein